MNALTLLQLTALSALWGASFLFIRMASPLLGPAVMAGLRIGLATLTLAVLMRALRQRWPWVHWRELLHLGFLSVALPFILYAWAALHIPAGYSALLNTTSVVFGCIAGAWMKVDVLTPRKLLGCFLGFVGVALVVRLGPVDLSPQVLLAALACTLAAACYGISTPLAKRAVTRIEPLAIAAGIHLWSLVLLAPAAAWQWPQAKWSVTALVAVAVMGIVTSALAYWVHLRIMRRVSATAAMTPAFMIPLFGVAWGHIFLNEPVSAGMLVGAALVLIATGLVSGFNPFAKPGPAKPEATKPDVAAAAP
jgi:drug/metabolite transporter (DMT)-like permease